MERAVTDVLSPQTARLTSGPFADRLQDALATYLAMPLDDVMHGFRLRAGLPAPGSAMDGWSSSTSEATFGQWVSGLARLGLTAGSEQARQRAIDLVEAYGEVMDADPDLHLGTYSWEKLMCGLVDTAAYAGHEHAVELADRAVAWAAGGGLSEDRRPARPDDFAAGDGHALEWYTLGENTYKAAFAGADAADYARTFGYEAYWDCFGRAPEPGQPWPVPTWLHAYSHVNTFASAAAVYEATGQEHYLRVLRNAYDYLVGTQTFATGGFGPGEMSVPEDGSLGRALEWRTDTAEIVCGSWAGFKMCAALLRHTGDARYLDWAETLLYSGLGTTTPVRVDGTSPYYQDMRLGIATKLPHWDHWPCCSGTYVQAVATVPELIYHADAEGIAVGLYLPSRVSVELGGRTITLEQTTAFPQADTSRLVIGGAAGRFALRLRVPGWTTGLSVTVNGEASDAVGQIVDGWLPLERDWSAGDVVEVTLGARLRVLPVDRWHPNRVALAHGPVVLAQEADWTIPLSLATPWPTVDLDAAFAREEGLRYRPVGVGTARLKPGVYRPLSDVPERRPYRVYADVDAPRIL